MKTPNLSQLSLRSSHPSGGTSRQLPREQEALFRTSLYLTPSLHRALKLRMIDEGRDMSAIMRDALDQYLKSGSGISS